MRSLLCYFEDLTACARKVDYRKTVNAQGMY